VKLPDCGHSPHRDQPGAVIAATVGLVDRVLGQAVPRPGPEA